MKTTDNRMTKRQNEEVRLSGFDCYRFDPETQLLWANGAEHSWANVGGGFWAFEAWKTKSDFLADRARVCRRIG